MGRAVLSDSHPARRIPFDVRARLRHRGGGLDLLRHSTGEDGARLGVARRRGIRVRPENAAGDHARAAAARGGGPLQAVLRRVARARQEARAHPHPARPRFRPIGTPRPRRVLTDPSDRLEVRPRVPPQGMDPRRRDRAARGASRGARTRGRALDSAPHDDHARRAPHGGLRLHQVDGAEPRPHGLFTYPGGPAQGTRGVDKGDRDSGAESSRVVRIREQPFRGTRSFDSADASGNDGAAGHRSGEARRAAHAVLIPPFTRRGTRSIGLTPAARSVPRSYRSPDCAVALNVSGEPVSPVAVALTVCLPTVEPSVQLVDATPVALETADATLTWPPPVRMANWTVTPATAFPPASWTITLSGVASVVFTRAVWLFPPLIAMLAAGPAPMLKDVVVALVSEPEAARSV